MNRLRIQDKVDLSPEDKVKEDLSPEARVEDLKVLKEPDKVKIKETRDQAKRKV